MGLIRRLLGLTGSTDPTGLDDRGQGEPYRCLACGTGYERNHAECRECGAQFVVEAGDEKQSPDPDRA